MKWLRPCRLVIDYLHIKNKITLKSGSPWCRLPFFAPTSQSHLINQDGVKSKSTLGQVQLQHKHKKKEMKDYLHVRDVEDGERNQIDSMQRSKFSLSLYLLLLKSKMANNKKKSNWFNSNVNLPCLDPSPFFLLRNGKSSLCPAAIEILTIPLARRFIYPLTHPKKTGLLYSYWSMEVAWSVFSLKVKLKWCPRSREVIFRCKGQGPCPGRPHIGNPLRVPRARAWRTSHVFLGIRAWNSQKTYSENERICFWKANLLKTKASFKVSDFSPMYFFKTENGRWLVLAVKEKKKKYIFPLRTQSWRVVVVVFFFFVVP